MLFRFHFFRCIRKYVKLYKNPQSNLSVVERSTGWREQINEQKTVYTHTLSRQDLSEACSSSMGMVIIKLPLQLIHEMRTTIRSWKKKKKQRK